MKLTVLRRKRNRSRREATVMSSPSMTALPAVGESSAPIRLSSVVLPLPEGPSMTMNSPWPISRSTPARAVTVTAPSS